MLAPHPEEPCQYSADLFIVAHSLWLWHATKRTGDGRGLGSDNLLRGLHQTGSGASTTCHHVAKTVLRPLSCHIS